MKPYKGHGGLLSFQLHGDQLYGRSLSFLDLRPMDTKTILLTKLTPK